MSLLAEHNITVFDNTDALAIGVARFIIDLANKSIAERGKFVIALSGGSTPEKLFTFLAGDSYNQQMPWAKTYIFWGDERYVPLDDKQNNSFVARQLLLDRINIPTQNIFVTPVNLVPAGAAAMAYEQTIQSFFNNRPAKFDLIMLGLGENAHTASLFPYTEVLHENEEGIRAVYVDEVKMFRITMTAPMINEAHNILFLVAGQSKAEVVKTILLAPHNPDEYPAQLINPTNGQLYWYIDRAASIQLSL